MLVIDLRICLAWCIGMVNGSLLHGLAKSATRVEVDGFVVINLHHVRGDAKVMLSMACFEYTTWSIWVAVHEPPGFVVSSSTFPLGTADTASD